ncbi:MAG: phosphoglycerate kinase [Patescibacteria group bacterium]
MQSIKKLKNIEGKIALVRVDFNVPIKNDKVEDDFRIKKAIPTIKFLQNKGAKIVLISHLGKGLSASGTSGESLLPVGIALNKFIKAKFVPNIFGKIACDAIFNMKNKDVILLENLRNDKGEQSLNKNFAKNLSKLADFYVNEAFSVSHRKDSSIVLLPKLLDSYAGLQLEEEVKNLSLVFKKPKKPFLFILGGAKFSTKMPLIQKYLKSADNVFIGGALANNFLKAKGFEIGKSLVSDSKGIEKILKNNSPLHKAMDGQGKLILPIDVVVSSKNKFINKKVSEIKKNETILDIGKESIKMIEPYIKKSKLILWNGPLGKYESGGDVATKKIIKILVLQSNTKTIIGGGDLVSVLSKLESKNYKLKPNLFVSTGGGATLDFLVNGTLPGIKALG